MRVFVTGATGFIGSTLVPELLRAGHQVLGLARSDASAASLRAAGAQVHRGDLEHPESLADGAARSDGVIHCAFDHDFSRFASNCEQDARAITALGAALAGTRRPLLITSGVGMGIPAPGHPATEDVFDAAHANSRRLTEVTAQAVAADGVNVTVVRLPQVHDTTRHGLISFAIALAREKGVSAYVGDGGNRYAAVHLTDSARLYRLALEKAEPGARYHAVAEEGITFRAVAEAIGRGLGVPVVSMPEEEAAAHFGWLGLFVGMDLSATSDLTRERLGWRPSGPGLIADLDAHFGRG